MADFVDILKDIGRGVGIAASDLLGITQARQEHRDRELAAERQRLLMEQIALQTEATRESLARGRREEKRDIGAAAGELLRGLPEEELALIGQETPDITPGETVPNVERSPAKDSKGRPINIVTGGVSPIGTDIEAAIENLIAGAPITVEDVVKTASGRARLLEKGDKKEREEAIAFEIDKGLAVVALQSGFVDPESKEVQVEAALDYLSTEREFKSLFNHTQLENLQVNIAQGRQSILNAKASLELTRKKLEEVEPHTRHELLQAANRQLVGLAKVKRMQAELEDRELSWRDAYRASVIDLVTIEAANPALGGLYIDLGSMIDGTFDVGEEGGEAIGTQFRVQQQTTPEDRAILELLRLSGAGSPTRTGGLQ